MSNPVEPEPTGPSLREIFGWRFWLNYVLCLIVTIWIPLAQVQVEVNGVLQGEPKLLPLYNIYGQLWKDPSIWAPWKFVLAHLGITFSVMATVWWLVLRRPPPKPATTFPKSDND